MQDDVTCQWTGCDQAAESRVSFGYRIAEPEVVPTIHKLDLCATHITRVESEFRIITIDVGTPADDEASHNDAAVGRAA